MRVSAVLADSAQAYNGKAHALGLGWTTTTTPTPAMVLLVFGELEEREEFKPGGYSFSGVLIDSHGQPVVLPTGPVAFNVKLETGQPTVTELIRIQLVLNIQAGLPLLTGRFRWVVTVNETGDNSSVSFVVHDQPQT